MDAYSWWMVEKNLEHAEKERLDVVVARLRANGYPTVAAEVERIST